MTEIDARMRACPPLDLELYEHQKRGYVYVLQHLFDDPVRIPYGRGAALLMEQGCGKTFTAAAALGALFQTQRATRAVVLCPLSVVGVWERDLRHIKLEGFPPIRIINASGDAKKRAKAFALANQFDADGYPPTVVIINYDSAWRKDGKTVPLLSYRPEVAILDEGHKIKDHSTTISKFARQLGQKVTYRLLLTGTAITNSPMDIFSEYLFVDPGVFGTSFYGFRGRYFDMVGYGFHTPVFRKHLFEEFTDKIASRSFRVTKAECLDLPPKTDEVRTVELEPKAMKIYRQLVKESYSDLVSGGLSANNVLTRMLRLSQLTGGHLRGDEAEYAETVSTAKLDALRDVLSAAKAEHQKVVVIGRFTAEINAIRALCEEMKLGYSTIAGDINDRADQIERFQTDPETLVFVGQIAACCTGITLHAAHLMVFYSMDYSMANFEQCRDRIHRIGMDTTQPCHYIYLCAKGTVDLKVLASVREKRDLAKSMIDDARRGINPYEYESEEEE